VDKLAHADAASTQADLAYEALLAEILECRLAPGAKIIISEIAGRLGFSPGAVREALSRLAAEKWTVATAQKGYSVTPVSADELKDLTRTRITIEQLCLRAAITHGDVEWETHLVAAYHRLHRIPMMDASPRVNPAWASAHTTFHAALVAGCDSPWMLTLRSMLYARWPARTVTSMPSTSASSMLVSRANRNAHVLRSTIIFNKPPKYF
jgi:GntR family carbon starvation induced transcriptional regulator